MTAPVVLDNTVLTNFALVARADLPGLLWAEAVCTAQPAMDEYQIGVAHGLLPATAWETLPVVALTDEELLFAAQLSQVLCAGERACLAVAFCRRGLLATDDLDARRSSRTDRVTTTGSLGILILAAQQDKIGMDQANALLADMIEAGFRSPLSRLDQYMKR